jgi:BirA family transcriptional regulator, biotin operon repressor / biotin---[acetyl-CoA-carboxylase] ligase
MSDFDSVAPHLPEPYRILWREKVSSTNDELRTLAEQGAAEGLILIAEEQSAGRGRRGAQWFSPKGESLAFSIILRPSDEKCFWSRISLAAGLAVAEALEHFLPLAEIKWPNDVLCGGKKIAGILVEAGGDFVILGIGINVNTEHFPAELAATSLRCESGQHVRRAEVLLEVVKRLAIQLGRIDKDFELVRAGIRERCALTGKQVAFTDTAGRREGDVMGIGAGGELLIFCNGKLESLIQADEVRVI